MKKFVIAFAACAALASCNVTGKPGALAASVGADVRYAARVNTGVTPAGSQDYTLVAIITNAAGEEIDRLPFLRGGAPILFEDKETCETFLQLPFYPQIHEGLLAYVAKQYGPDAKADESCVPSEQ